MNVDVLIVIYSQQRSFLRLRNFSLCSCGENAQSCVPLNWPMSVLSCFPAVCGAQFSKGPAASTLASLWCQVFYMQPCYLQGHWASLQAVNLTAQPNNNACKQYLEKRLRRIPHLALGERFSLANLVYLSANWCLIQMWAEADGKTTRVKTTKVFFS